MMIPLWYGLIVGAAMAYFGFWFGRSRNWGLIGSEERGTKLVEKGETGKAPKKENGHGQVLPYVRYLSSPTGGMVETLDAGEGVGVRIVTTESKLYSPSAGRVLSISPRGNAFLIMADWGGEVEVRACNSEDDLLDRFFRPRVIKGEVIRRGKLLLEYDREKLSRECEDTAVYLTARGERGEEIESIDNGKVQKGEALLWVK